MIICTRVHQLRGGEVVSKTKTMYMNIRMEVFTYGWYQEASEQLVQMLDTYIKDGSNWIVEAIEKVAVIIVTYLQVNPCKGHADMTLPKKLNGKNAVTTLTGVPEGQCFRYSVLAAIYWHKLIKQNQRLAKKD